MQWLRALFLIRTMGRRSLTWPTYSLNLFAVRERDGSSGCARFGREDN